MQKRLDCWLGRALTVELRGLLECARGRVGERVVVDVERVAAVRRQRERAAGDEAGNEVDTPRPEFGRRL